MSHRSNWLQQNSSRLSTLVVFLLLNLFPLLASADALVTEPIPLSDQINHSTLELNELRAQIASHRQQLQDLNSQEDDTNQKLVGVVKEVALVKNLLSGLDAREKILVAQRDTLQVRLELHRQMHSAKKQNFTRRMTDIYKHGRQRPLELIMTSESFSSLLTRLRFSTVMARIDGTLIAQTKQQANQIEREQRQLQAALAGIWEAREEGTQERARLELLETDRRFALSEIQEQREFAQSSLQGLQDNEARLADLIGVLERRRQSQSRSSGKQTSTLAESTGHLRWPVSGRVVRKFGKSVHPQFNTVTVNNGINIATIAGSPVYAVASGIVEFADHLPGFGVCIIVDHGAGFYTLYANLDRVFVIKGENINQSEVLAEVGETDDTSGPQLYFEVRQGKTPLDPLEWLQPRG